MPSNHTVTALLRASLKAQGQGQPQEGVKQIWVEENHPMSCASYKLNNDAWAISFWLTLKQLGENQTDNFCSYLKPKKAKKHLQNPAL